MSGRNATRCTGGTFRVRFPLANPLPDLCDLDVVHLVVTAGGLQCEANDVRAAELVTDLKSVWNAKLGAINIAADRTTSYAS